jgi:hypothetical protein
VPYLRQSEVQPPGTGAMSFQSAPPCGSEGSRISSQVDRNEAFGQVGTFARLESSVLFNLLPAAIANQR